MDLIQKYGFLLPLGNEITSKINQLIRKWPRGPVATASYLKRQGFTYDLLTKYRRSGWIKSFGQGAYVLPEDRVEWPGALYPVQSQLELEFHAGGKTALELKGYGHYVPAETRILFLYAQPKVILPAWFSGERFGLSLVVIRTGLFPGNSREGFSEWKERESHKFNCPNCGYLQDNVVWTSLNVSLDPTLREKLFNGEIHVLVCQKCGNRAFISTPLLYHDMKRKYFVQYYPVQAIEDAEFFKGFTKDGKLNMGGLSKAMGEIGDYMVEPHIVFDLNEMIQYIKFRDKLHDLHKEMVS